MTLQRFLDDTDDRVHLRFEDEANDDGPEPWALGDDEPEPLEGWDFTDELSDADRWLDEQLGLQPGPSDDDPDLENGVGAATLDGNAPRPEPPVRSGGDGDLILRHPASARRPRRRRADLDAAADLPPPIVPGYVRDRRGTWRYRDGGAAVPGARDVTLRSLYRWPVQRGQVLVPVEAVRSEAELAWCVPWKHTLTTRLDGGRVVRVLRVPVGEWERRADVPFGLWAPELTASRLLGISDVARLAGVSPATITAYLSRRYMPQPVTRIGNSPVWSRPVIAQWLAGRPGRGVRGRQRTGVRLGASSKRSGSSGQRAGDRRRADGLILG